MKSEFKVDTNNLKKFSEDFMQSREQPPQQEREDLFEPVDLGSLKRH